VIHSLQGVRWRTPLAALAAAIIAILALFRADTLAMADQWWNSSTYQHCLFVLPITGWLIWQRRQEVSAIAPQSWAPGLALVALAALAWLVGEAAGASLIRHAALVLMIQASVLAILGPNATRALLFPVFYLVFLVPFGDEFVPALQTLTAKIVIALVHLSGLEAHIDGIFITTRAGWFEVAEECSGVKFLIAMVAYGALVANVCFRAWPRRAAFMALCMVAPVLANGVRAFATIYAAHLTSVEVATGFDHIVYGWFFFGFVMLLVIAAGWKFFDRKPGDPWIEGMPTGVFRSAAVIPSTLAAIGIAALPVLWMGTVVASGRAALPNTITLPQVTGWTFARTAPAVPWVARFDGADHRLYGRYTDGKSGFVDIAIALYGWQAQGRELVAFGQGAADPESRWKWAGNLPAPVNGKAERIMGPSKLARTAISFYVLGSGATGDEMTVKMRTLQSRLMGGDQRAATIIVSTEDLAGAPAEAVLARFLTDFGDPRTRAEALFAEAGAR
jgi:exosortase A